MPEPRFCEAFLDFYTLPHFVDPTACKSTTMENGPRCLGHLGDIPFARQSGPHLHTACAVSPATDAGSVTVPFDQQVLPPFTEQAAALGRFTAQLQLYRDRAWFTLHEMPPNFSCSKIPPLPYPVVFTFSACYHYCRYRAKLPITIGATAFANYFATQTLNNLHTRVRMFARSFAKLGP